MEENYKSTVFKLYWSIILRRKGDMVFCFYKTLYKDNMDITIKITKDNEIDIINNDGVMTANGNIQYFASDKLSDEFNELEVSEICKRNKGFAVVKKKDCIEIYNDPFCTIPLY